MCPFSFNDCCFFAFWYQCLPYHTHYRSPCRLNQILIVMGWAQLFEVRWGILYHAVPDLLCWPLLIKQCLKSQHWWFDCSKCKAYAHSIQCSLHQRQLHSIQSTLLDPLKWTSYLTGKPQAATLHFYENKFCKKWHRPKSGTSLFLSFLNSISHLNHLNHFYNK